MKRLLLVIAIALCASTLRAETIEGIEYASMGGKPLLADVRTPDGAGPFPTIIYLHSGAWISGDRTGGPALRHVSRGYAVVSIDYPLAPQFVWPAQIEACKAAVRWVRANAARFHFDPDRVGVFGASSGGHLASVLGTSGGIASLEGLELGNPQYSSRVKAVIDFYGPTNLLKLDEQKLPCILLDGNASYMPPSLLMGCPIQSCKEKTATANPMTYATPDDPPFLIVQGMLDCLVSYKQSVLLDDALQMAGVDSTLVLIPNGDHGGRAFDDQKYKDIVDDFLDKKLRVALPLKKRAAKR